MRSIGVDFQYLLVGIYPPSMGKDYFTSLYPLEWKSNPFRRPMLYAQKDTIGGCGELPGVTAQSILVVTSFIKNCCKEECEVRDCALSPSIALRYPVFQALSAMLYNLNRGLLRFRALWWLHRIRFRSSALLPMVIVGAISL